MLITLTTTGRNSGQPRTVELYAYEDGESIVIVGSNGGKKHNPGWVHNLRAHPDAVVRRGQTDQRVRATETTGKPRERAWELAASQFPLYRKYQQRTERLIPVFVLEPVGA